MSFSLIIIAFIFSIVKAFFQKKSTIYKYTYRILICICLSPAIDKSVRRYKQFCWARYSKPKRKLSCSTYTNTVSLIMNFFNKKRTSLRSPLIICVNSELLELNRSASSLKLCLDLLSVSLRNTFLDSLRSTLNEFLRLLKTKTCDLLNSLDNSHLSIAE